MVGKCSPCLTGFCRKSLPFGPKLGRAGPDLETMLKLTVPPLLLRIIHPRQRVRLDVAEFTGMSVGTCIVANEANSVMS